MNDACIAMILRARRWKRLWCRPTLLRLRHLDGCILSMEQSGTHWMRYMLGLCMAETYGKPPPETIQSPEFIGCVRDRPLYPELPQIISSHARPHALLCSQRFCRGRHLPRYLLLVRDIRHVLVSHYEKWQHEYRVDFPTFLRGDPTGLRRWSDLWREIEFLNAWGDVVAAGAVATRVVRYEETRRDTPGALAAVCAYFGIPATPETCARVAAATTKEKMSERSRPPRDVVIVRRDPRPALAWFTEEDRVFLTRACRRHLRHSFGYDYEDWAGPAAPKATP